MADAPEPIRSSPDAPDESPVVNSPLPLALEERPSALRKMMDPLEALPRDAPLVRNTSPPWAFPEAGPADTSTLPPTSPPPLSPLAIVIEPAAPRVLPPDAIATLPDEPLFDVPVWMLRKPLALESAVEIRTAPPVPAVLSPDTSRRRPPVAEADRDLPAAIVTKPPLLFSDSPADTTTLPLRPFPDDLPVEISTEPDAPPSKARPVTTAMLPLDTARLPVPMLEPASAVVMSSLPLESSVFAPRANRLCIV